MSANVPPSILGTMKQDGSRITMHPADVKGRWLTRRRVVFAALVLFYVGAPLLTVGGHPAIQLDVAARRFYLFGNTFNAQDFWMVLLLALSFVFGLLAVTAWKGRVWCGWGCPQTVFLEGVYRPIERLIDGSREQRQRLDAAPWTWRKALRRAVKFVVFLVVSINIAHAAAAVFVGPKALLAMIVDGPFDHPEAFMLVAGFSAVLQFNFAWFREQFCVVLCPYGRLQSILHDRDSVTVSYFERRGEPRGKLSKDPAAPPRGDCVDCNRCVTACPTGIDIRNGLQMECLACLQCVDACDDVMTKLKKPTGLIGFSSQRALSGGTTKTLRPRLLIYVALSVLAIGTLGVSLASRTPFEANVIRTRGTNPFVIDGAVIRNPFEVHVFNKSPDPTTYRLELRAPVAAEITVSTPEVQLHSLSDARVRVLVSIDRALVTGPLDLELEVTDLSTGEKKLQPVRFLSPMSVGR